MDSSQNTPKWEEGMLLIQSFAIGCILGWVFWVATCLVAIMAGAGDWMAANSEFFLMCSLVAGALLGLGVGVWLLLRAGSTPVRKWPSAVGLANQTPPLANSRVVVKAH